MNLLLAFEAVADDSQGHGLTSGVRLCWTEGLEPVDPDGPG